MIVRASRHHGVQVGGGNYVEYQNLVELAEVGWTCARLHSLSQRSGGKKTIVYGTTELLTASSFLQQLGRLQRDD